MADAISAIVGMALMIAFLLAIAIKLAETSLWIVCISAIVLMVAAFWRDAFAPLIRGTRRNGS